ncbi:hypothetical protein AZI86_04265 [Bdellovibrio bacteriovorus]|uniref:histidine kinase n=1 Tax=Bdellovibrio bacteriovorus TaxID=959 RepID=A0A150WPD0_BDEBC|nr:response regulator [Bdellovibrio bacteriovorus]KYG66280.1 hypothetical protein AZI86_04265 [Bdellovibrio bacteriovorus]
MKTRVLIVDDDPDNLEFLSEYIASEDVEIHSVRSEEEALRSLRTQRFSVAFSISSDLQRLKGKVDVFLRLTHPTQPLPHFREPLSSVIGFAELLREGDLSPTEQKKATEVILRNAGVLWRLIGGEKSPPSIGSN